MTLDGSSRAAELARATARHIQDDGYLVLEKGISAERVASLLHMSRSAVHSSLIRMGKSGNDNGLLRNLAEHWLDPKKADVVLPLAVALFRFTSPAMNLAVVIYVAWLFGIELTPWEMGVGLAVAMAAALSSVSLPGSISFVTSIAPIAVSMGVPVAPLGLLVAVETFPDIFRTLGNVVGDVAATKYAADGVETAEPTGETP